MVVSSIFLGLINLILCVNGNERKLYNSSDSDAYYTFNNYPNLDYGNSQNGDEPSLFGSGLKRSNQFIELDHFLFHDQDTKLDHQYIGQSDYMIPDLKTFEKEQEIQSQVSINNFYPTPTLSNQQFSMNQASFKSIILSQNSDQNNLISNLQSFPISSSQIQEFQNKLIDSGDHKAKNRKPNQFLTKRKRQYMPWRAHELDNLLKGVNEYGKHWRKIFKLYKFEKGRTSTHLCLEFHALKRDNKIAQTEEGRWKFISRGELIDLVRGGEENEQIQSKQEKQGDVVNNKSKSDLGNPDQNSVGKMIKNYSQEQDLKGPFFVETSKKRRWISWKEYEFTNLIEGINIYGYDWKKIHQSLEFEQGRTPYNLYIRFSTLKKRGQVTFTNDFGWKFANERVPTHSDENESSKATENQIQGKGQKQKGLFLVEKEKSRKHHYLSWKKHELDNLLEGVNKYGRNWKKIFDSYEFEGRSSKHLTSRFMKMENNGQIIYEEKLGWRYTDPHEEKIRNRVIFERDLTGKSFSHGKACRVSQDLSAEHKNFQTS